MSAKTVAIWSTAALLLAVAAIAWVGYIANGLVYGDAVGVRGNETQVVAIGARVTRFLALALISEAFGVATIVWRLLNEKAMALRLMAAVGIAFLAIACTFAFVRPL
jgi:hypothetical protein